MAVSLASDTAKRAAFAASPKKIFRFSELPGRIAIWDMMAYNEGRKRLSAPESALKNGGNHIG